MGELISTARDLALIGYIASTMLAMGLKLAVEDLKETFARRRLILLSLVVNLVAVPGVAAIALLVFELPASAVIAIVLLASAPGYAPIMSARARGDLPFSTSLILLFSAISVVTVPITATLLFAGQAVISVDPWEIIRPLLLFQLIPLGLGMWFRRRDPELAGRVARPLVKLATTLISIAGLSYVFMLFTLNGNPLAALGWQTWLAWALVVVAALGAGYAAGGPSVPSRRTLSLHSVVRNVGLSLIIATSAFDAPVAEIAIIGLALLMYAIAIFTTLQWQKSSVSFTS